MSIRSKKGEEDLTPEVPLLDERLLASPGLAIEQARSVVLKICLLYTSWPSTP